MPIQISNRTTAQEQFDAHPAATPAASTEIRGAGSATKALKLMALTLGFAGLLTLALSDVAHAQVWQDTRIWDDQAEEQYSRWVEDEFNEKIFTEGKYAGIPTDCADAAYYARLIFAYENKLPFRIHSGLSNRSTQFNGKPELERVRRFMNLVGDNTSTRTLALDTYPVKISREFVRPGAVWSRPSLTSQGVLGWFLRAFMVFTNHTETSSGHATIIKRVEPTGAIWMIESTLPKQTRDLVETANLHFMPELVDVPSDMKDPSARQQLRYGMGLRKWRQPQQYGQPLERLPGFSTEQFEFGIDPRTVNNHSETNNHESGTRSLDSWTREVFARLADGAEENPAQTAARLAESLCNAAHARVKVVNQALNTLARRGQCLDEKSNAYDDLSTPSRDKRARKYAKDLISLTRPAFFWEDAKMKAEVVRLLSLCPTLQIGQGQTLTLGEYIDHLAAGRVSSNPNHSREDRWGIANEQRLACQ